MRAKVSAAEWQPSITGPERGFRTKAKLVVTGTSSDPRLGILQRTSDGFHGIDLRDCPLYSPGLAAAFPVLAGFITEATLAPYDVATRRGELKHLIVTEAPSGELMVRFVLRSTEAESRIRKHLPTLLSALPQLRVVSINLQPEHKAVLEGEREILLTDADALPMLIGSDRADRGDGVPLLLRPQSFFQTNTGIAEALYATASDWASGLRPEPRQVWDLYCGVGGFALSLSRELTTATVTGVEISTEAVIAAQAAAALLGVSDRCLFVAGDATAFAREQAQVARPDLIVVNPPRRGLGGELAGVLNDSGARHVLYSSCQAETLTRDLNDLSEYDVTRGVLLDMFPHTTHYEVLVLLTRRTQVD